MIKHYLAKIVRLIQLTKVAVFPLLNGNTRIRFTSNVLGCLRREFGSRSTGTAGKDWKQQRKLRYTNTT